MNYPAPYPTINNVYTLFGEASHWASILEEQLCNLCMLNERVINQEKYRTESPQSIVERFEKLEIGKLMKRLKKNLGMEVENNVIDKIFRPALDRRNYLIHRFFMHHHDILKDENKIPDAIDELNEIKNSIAQAAAIATQVCSKMVEQYQAASRIVVDYE